MCDIIKPQCRKYLYDIIGNIQYKVSNRDAISEFDMHSQSGFDQRSVNKSVLPPKFGVYYEYMPNYARLCYLYALHVE